MNPKILQKCVEELKKETFSKEYVLGMLETVIEMSGGLVQIAAPYNGVATTVSGVPPTTTTVPYVETEEEMNMSNYLHGAAPLTI
jgi:hypothetical protein